MLIEMPDENDLHKKTGVPMTDNSESKKLENEYLSIKVQLSSARSNLKNKNEELIAIVNDLEAEMSAISDKFISVLIPITPVIEFCKCNPISGILPYTEKAGRKICTKCSLPISIEPGEE